MSKIYPPSISDGDMHTPSHKNSHRKAQGALRDNNKKPMKSNITNKVKSKYSTALPSRADVAARVAIGASRPTFVSTKKV